MNIHTLAAQLSLAGHHDLVEELLSVHLNEDMSPVKIGSSAGDVEFLETLLDISASSWLAAAQAAHSTEDTYISREFLDLANSELRTVSKINDEIRRNGSAGVVQINPVAITADSDIDDVVEIVLSRAHTREDHEELSTRLRTAKMGTKQRKMVMLQWEALKKRNGSLPVPRKPEYDVNFHQKLARFFQTKKFNVIEHPDSKEKLGIVIEVPNINRAKLESNRLNKYVPVQKKSKDGTHIHGLPTGAIAIIVKSRDK